MTDSENATVYETTFGEADVEAALTELDELRIEGEGLLEKAQRALRWCYFGAGVVSAFALNSIFVALSDALVGVIR